MAETQVNPQITDAVTQTNVKTLGESPAEALGVVYQTLAHSAGMAMENVEQAGMSDIDDSTASTE
ncbi:MAG: RebB family R body protein [Methylobacter sp.]